MARQFSQYLDTFDLLDPCQSEYRPGYETKTALVALVNERLLAMDENQEFHAGIIRSIRCL